MAAAVPLHPCPTSPCDLLYIPVLVKNGLLSVPTTSDASQGQHVGMVTSDLQSERHSVEGANVLSRQLSRQPLHVAGRDEELVSQKQPMLHEIQLYEIRWLIWRRERMGRESTRTRLPFAMPKPRARCKWFGFDCGLAGDSLSINVCSDEVSTEVNSLHGDTSWYIMIHPHTLTIQIIQSISNILKTNKWQKHRNFTVPTRGLFDSLCLCVLKIRLAVQSPSNLSICTAPFQRKW